MYSKIGGRPLFSTFVIRLLLLVGVVLVVGPFLWAISTSLKTPAMAVASPPRWIPVPAEWKNYGLVWSEIPLARYFLNSIIQAVSVTVGQIFICSLAAYAFARLKFPFRNTIFLVILGTMMIPFQITMVPLYVMIVKFGWLNTFFALILPSLASPFGTFLVRQYLLSIPNDLEDAAVIDGCNKFRIYRSVMMPLAKPALATLAITTFMSVWDMFVWPLVVTSSPQMRTIQVGVAQFQGNAISTFPDWPMMMTASVIAAVPVIIIFSFLQRQYVQGVAMSGLKM